MSNPHVFSIHGQGLKLNTRADIEPHLKKLKEMKDVEEVHFGGNTLGVEASEALAEVLVGLKSLKVSAGHVYLLALALNYGQGRRFRGHFHGTVDHRNPTSPRSHLQLPQGSHFSRRDQS